MKSPWLLVFVMPLCAVLSARADAYKQKVLLVCPSINNISCSLLRILWPQSQRAPNVWFFWRILIDFYFCINAQTAPEVIRRQSIAPVPEL